LVCLFFTTFYKQSSPAQINEQGLVVEWIAQRMVEYLLSMVVKYVLAEAIGSTLSVASLHAST